MNVIDEKYNNNRAYSYIQIVLIIPVNNKIYKIFIRLFIVVRISRTDKPFLINYWILFARSHALISYTDAKTYLLNSPWHWGVINKSNDIVRLSHLPVHNLQMIRWTSSITLNLFPLIPVRALLSALVNEH